MFCVECGEKLALVLHNQEGLVPFCKNCNQYRFPQFATAALMVAANRNKDKVLLAKHRGSDDFILLAGYVKKGETAEKAVTREFKEETGLNTVKYKYLSSKYHEPKNVLMLGFLLIAENGEIAMDESEIEEIRWFSFEEALKTIKKNTIAEGVLQSAIIQLKNNRI